jgi:Ca2+-binding RTX toxin-like protein
MKIKFNLAPTSPYSATDIFGIIDFIAVEGVVVALSSTSFSGFGTYDGAAASYTVTGSGFTTTVINGDTFVNGGIVDTVTFTSQGNVVPFTDVDINMAVFGPIIVQDVFGIDLTAIEDFLQSRAWNVTLGNANDVVNRSTIVEDGVPFNLLGNDVIRGKKGNDDLYSGDGADRLEGGLGSDILDGGAGKDKVFGGFGNDIVKGSGGADQLFGDAGKDLLLGGGGNDILTGGRGNDKHSGGKGFDTFVFADDDGADAISAFDLDDREKIDLSAVTRITGFSDLKNNHMKQAGNQTVIDDGAGTRIVLFRIDMDDLGSGDFMF